MSDKLKLSDHMYQVFAHYEHYQPRPKESGNWGARLLFDPINLTLAFEVQYGECTDEARRSETIPLSEFAKRLKDIAAENILVELR